MKSLTKPELDSLLSTALQHSVRDHLMFLLAFNHGLRISEVLALTSDNFNAGYIITSRKKGSRKAEHPLLASERELLTQYMHGKCGLLFPVSRQHAWRLIKRYAREAGIPEHRVHPHVLKHTCGRVAYQNGVGLPDIQRYLGHVNGANTMIYMQSDDQEAAKAFANVLGS